MTYFYAKDHEALTVLIRFADSLGEKITRVVPINDGFAVIVTGDVEVSNQTDLKPFKSDLDSRRTYWEDIVNVSHESIVFVGIE